MSNFCLGSVSEMSRNHHNRHPVWPPIWGKRHSCRFSSSGKRHSCRFPHWLSHRLKRQECRFPGGARRPAEPPRESRAVPTAAPHGRAAVPSAAAQERGPPAWNAAILAALQPPADHHRISQSPVVETAFHRRPPHIRRWLCEVRVVRRQITRDTSA